MPQLTAREAAFFALIGHPFIEDSLKEWQKSNPSQKDFNLAFEIAYGTCRQKRALDYLAEKFLNLNFLPKKKKELALLEMTLYQIFFLERIPQFAIVSESVSLAKKHISLPFSKFINATFRHLKKNPWYFRMIWL